ncbi:hypothetical protein DAPPUDRAFT_266417 [Daphnia pulex]|uniref:Uncharacterized protein n=1 Tax=Daphnia pulex TaxID=6669 RepID=E9HV03_DAPPU|nr:hypothetical protein DAPPUDRAFT_266417 [Daphnia pulex]|eukprot:EFX64427.1 hypothetical protein DAPPUDRAFT_266417 [Daphnia pulex]
MQRAACEGFSTENVDGTSQIPKMFAVLKSQSLSLDVNLTQANLLKKFLDFVEKQWITNPIWPTTKWTSFNQVIHTNNDAEGWHSRVNNMTRQMGLLKKLKLSHFMRNC